MAKKRLKQVQELARAVAGSEAVDRGAAERFHGRFRQLSSTERAQFFSWMAGDLEVDRAALTGPIERLLDTPPDDAAGWGRRVLELRRAIASPRREVLASLINIPGGMKFILELRAEILELQRGGRRGLEPVEEEIASALNDWCAHGFLFLEEIDSTSPFERIRYLKDRELVHPMLSLEEMGNRLGADRLCFALYHVVMPDEPVVFIEVALSRGLVRSIHDIIDVDGHHRAPVTSPDTAIFYSINNTQEGLAGLGFGKVLVFRVTEALRSRHPTLKTFATLSPIPGFRSRYLLPILRGDGHRFSLSVDGVLERFPSKSMDALRRRHREVADAGGEPAAVLTSILSRSDWFADPVFRSHLSKPLREIAYVYLAQERDRRGRPLNPVANFHLGNGATLSERNVNFGANTSPRGLEESCGLMVNYVYSRTTFQQLGSTVRSLLPWGRGGG